MAIPITNTKGITIGGTNQVLMAQLAAGRRWITGRSLRVCRQRFLEPLGIDHCKLGNAGMHGIRDQLHRRRCSTVGGERHAVQQLVVGFIG